MAREKSLDRFLQTHDYGREFAFETLLVDYDGLRWLDGKHPIIGSFRVETIPAGRDVPDEIRSQWVGVDLPVRYPHTIDAGGFEFTAEDAIISLFAAGKFDAARWFRDNSLDTWPAWMFDIAEGDFTDAREVQVPMTSLEYYGVLLGLEIHSPLE